MPVFVEKNKTLVRRITFNSSVIFKIKEMCLFNLICSSVFLKLCSSQTAVLPNAFMADKEGWDVY